MSRPHCGLLAHNMLVIDTGEAPLIFRGGPITSVTRLDHAGITVPFLGEKRPKVSVRVTPGIVVVPHRLNHVGPPSPYRGEKDPQDAPLAKTLPTRAYLREASTLHPWALFYGGCKIDL